MTAKSAIVEHLGEKGLLVPELITEALRANDRAKLRMTVLQEAVARARHPGQASRSLEVELRAAGMDGAALEQALSGARLLTDGAINVPDAEGLVAGVHDDIALMIAPFSTMELPEAATFNDRLDGLDLNKFAGEIIEDRDIARLTSAMREGGDTAHLLVMDLHKALNRLSAEVAVETLAGAHVLHVLDEDRPRIRAFMRGIDRTHGLAFGHPGLDTTAARSGERLVIQNDIGTTDAHVIIITVEARTVTITYTDVHLRRARFFIGLFDGRDMDWAPLAERKAHGLADDAAFFLVTGTYKAETEEDCCSFLEYLGSRLVFLIDWNKARKALQPFVSKGMAVRLLREAAAGDYGHRGYLELGGAGLLYDTIQRSSEGRIPYGTRLDEALGEDQAAALLGRILRLASSGLANGRSSRLLRDEVRAELSQCIVSVEGEILAIVTRQLGLARGLAGMVLAALADGHCLDAVAREQLGHRAKLLETKADMLTLQARDMAEGPMGRGRQFLPVVNSVEDAIDDLEEAAFLLSITPGECAGQQIADPLAGLARNALDCCGHLVRGVVAARSIPSGNRQDIADTLEGVEETIQAEKRADVTQREAIAAFVSVPGDARALLMGVETARALETSTDHLARAALVLRRCVLDDAVPAR